MNQIKGVETHFSESSNFLINVLQFKIFTDILVFIGVKKKMNNSNVNDDGKTYTHETVDLPVGATPVQPKLTRFMVGTYLDPMTREWMLSYVKFDPKTKTLGEVKTERVAGDMEVMKERLTIQIGKLGLLDVGDANEDNDKYNIY